MNYMPPQAVPDPQDPGMDPSQQDPQQATEQESPQQQDPCEISCQKLHTFLDKVANDGATSKDPDAISKLAQATFSIAEAIKQLMPPVASPDAQLKASADVVKVGAQQAHDQHQQEQQRQHDLAKTELEAVRQTANTGGQDGSS